MPLVNGIIASTVGCALCCILVAKSAQHRGIKKATAKSCFQSMLIGLTLGELIWVPFSVKPSSAESTHPLQFVFSGQMLAEMPLVGIMGCAAIVGTLYWGCTAVTLGLLSYRRWGIALHNATRVYLPWMSIWTLAHMGNIWWKASTLMQPTHVQ